METYIGAVDNRRPSDKKKDFNVAEFLVMGAPVFEERVPLAYTPRNQDGSGSCVAQTTAKMLEVWDYRNDKALTPYSATPIYQYRSNKPASGMIGVEALNFCREFGTYLETEVPSQSLNDTTMDTIKFGLPTQPVKPTNYATVDVKFDTVASYIQNYGAVMLWFKSDYSEWCRDIPEGLSDNESVRHSVCAVDIIKYEGKEYIIIEDSWGTWQNTSSIPLNPGQRAISRQFFNKHCYFAGVFTSFVFKAEVIPKPKAKFTKDLKYGSIGADVVSLQNILKYEGFFPSNQVSTGKFLSITAKAVVDWQLKHGFTDFVKEKDITKIIFGPKSRAVANKLYV